MSEKVLGFKEKDSYKHSLRCGDAVFPNDWVIADKKLVPVVSVEEHEAKIKALKEIIAGLMRNQSPAKTFRNAVEEKE